MDEFDKIILERRGAQWKLRLFRRENKIWKRTLQARTGTFEEALEQINNWRKGLVIA